ncbi:DNA polymerase III subunit beta [Anaerohalosphaera lusitana]|uniref:Beta sliding clamp n=1 Tax=Anaerohalosphaera lusitana TaxID=1936003 RepID=A0A1U9NHA1_9BACT|nr:DNA polymerase III subunit beta [Anaerohalosphaera lusitana]AQT67311.1 DNA polymerase III subunit beta [Anaerohalosphaera lusitana]
MKVKFNRAALQEALGLVTSVVPSRTPKPILQCVQIKTEVDAVTVCATDLEVGINYQVTQVEIEEQGEIVVPADKLSSIVRESVDEVIAIEESEATVEIKGADSHFTIYGHDADQYPSVPGFEGDAHFTISLGKLQEGIELTVFAAAKESTRYALNGILWEVEGKKLTLVATDGRRLARCAVNLDTVEKDSIPDGRIIVPAKTMNLLDRVGGSADTKVSVRFVDNQIVISCGQVIISSNLVEGNFPKYEDIIPKDYTNSIGLNTDAALSAVRRAALLSNEDSKGIKLALSDNKMTFSSRAPETGDAQVEMTIDYSGGEMEIGFNPAFLIDVLKVIKADDFKLELGDSERPGVIRSGDQFLYIVMPVNL